MTRMRRRISDDTNHPTNGSFTSSGKRMTVVLGLVLVSWILWMGGTPEYSVDLFVSNTNSRNASSGDLMNGGSDDAYHNDHTEVLIPSSSPDFTVIEHVSLAWTEVNGTERWRLRDDPYLSRMRSTSSNNSKNATSTMACPPTCQLRLDTTTWIVTSLDCQGQPKRVGGDEYYITYHRNHANTNDHANNKSPTAISRTQDRQDGTYQLNFYSSPFATQPSTTTTTDTTATATTHHLTVHFEYTCSLGALPVPMKQEWRTGGAVMTSYHNIVLPTAPSPLHPFVPPNADQSINLGQYDKVMVYGDSNLHNMVLYHQNQHKTHNSSSSSSSSNLVLTQKPDNPLIPGRPLQRLFLSKSHWFLNQTIQEHEQLRRNHSILHNNENANDRRNSYNNNIAIIYGSHTWDLVFGDQGRGVGPNYTWHEQACRTLITTTQQRFPHVDIYWHSGYALHVHVSDDSTTTKQWHTRAPLKYMSWSRSVELYELQSQWMTELQVPVLHFLEATYLAAEHYGVYDSRHIDRVLSNTMLEWYYPKV